MNRILSLIALSFCVYGKYKIGWVLEWFLRSKTYRFEFSIEDYKVVDELFVNGLLRVVMFVLGQDLSELLPRVVSKSYQPPPDDIPPLR
jgi:hypothetical protein